MGDRMYHDTGSPLECTCSPVKNMSLHVHYHTSMQALWLLGLHATVRGAGLRCIHASHAGVYTTGRYISDACALQAGMHTLPVILNGSGHGIE